jgi:multidrug efflux pump subunit AcrA (membrane-fusion protein)
MRVEIDVPNPDGKLRDGMYGEVVIHLQDPSPEAFTVPSSCLHKRQDRKGKDQWWVYVVRNDKVWRAAVTVGLDNGKQAEIFRVPAKGLPRGTVGLDPADMVVVDPGPFPDGLVVRALHVEATQPSD